MLNVPNFLKMTLTKEEVKKKYAISTEELPKVKRDVEVLQERLLDAETRIDLIKAEENAKINELTKTLVAEKHPGSFHEAIKQIREKGIEHDLLISGLKQEIEQKNNSIIRLEKELDIRDYLLALAELYPLYDAYNDQIPALARLLKQIHTTYCKAQTLASAADETLNRYTRFDNDNGMPEQLNLIHTENGENWQTGRIWNCSGGNAGLQDFKKIN